MILHCRRLKWHYVNVGEWADPCCSKRDEVHFVARDQPPETIKHPETSEGSLSCQVVREYFSPSTSIKQRRGSIIIKSHYDNEKAFAPMLFFNNATPESHQRKYKF